MPVGNSDRGVGLGAGEVMLFADFNMQEFESTFSEYQDLFYKKSSGLFNPSSADMARGKLIQLTST